MKKNLVVQTSIKCPICGRETVEKSERSVGWGCEEKVVHVCSCGWKSKAVGVR